MEIADNHRPSLSLGAMCVNQCLRVDLEMRARHGMHIARFDQTFDHIGCAQQDSARLVRRRAIRCSTHRIDSPFSHSNCHGRLTSRHWLSVTRKLDGMIYVYIHATMKRALSDPAECVCQRLRRAARNLTRRYDAALAPSGLNTGQFATLVTMDRMGAAPVSALAEMMDIERTALTRNLAVMEKNGWVERIEGEDRRERIVALSALGRTRLKECQPLWADAQAETISKIGDDAAQRLLLELAAFT